jgi:hypothetical protein
MHPRPLPAPHTAAAHISYLASYTHGQGVYALPVLIVALVALGFLARVTFRRAR